LIFCAARQQRKRFPGIADSRKGFPASRLVVCRALLPTVIPETAGARRVESGEAPTHYIQARSFSALAKLLITVDCPTSLAQSLNNERRLPAGCQNPSLPPCPYHSCRRILHRARCGDYRIHRSSRSLTGALDAAQQFLQGGPMNRRSGVKRLLQ
jgi:hypothetical protein